MVDQLAHLAVAALGLAIAACALDQVVHYAFFRPNHTPQHRAHHAKPVFVPGLVGVDLAEFRAQLDRPGSWDDHTSRPDDPSEHRRAANPDSDTHDLPVAGDAV